MKRNKKPWENKKILRNMKYQYGKSTLLLYQTNKERKTVKYNTNKVFIARYNRYYNSISITKVSGASSRDMILSIDLSTH